MATAGFEYVPNAYTPKVRCKVCGRTGFDGCRWQESCLKGHPYECTQCGALFSTAQGHANHVRLTVSHQGSGQQDLFEGA